jgi:hypothetical protein
MSPKRMASSHPFPLLDISCSNRSTFFGSFKVDELKPKCVSEMTTVCIAYTGPFLESLLQLLFINIMNLNEEETMPK